METLDHVHIFKTNLGTLCPNCAAFKALEAETSIAQWSVDHEDVDCVLRVVSEIITPAQIIELMRGVGAQCSELQ